MSSANISSFINAKIFNNSRSAANISSRNQVQSKVTSKKNRGVYTSLLKDSLVVVSRNNITTKNKQNLRITRTRSKRCQTGHLNKNNEKIFLTIFETPTDLNTRVGTCLVNYNTGEMILSDYLDSQIYIRTVNKIQLYEPTDILLPSYSLSPKMSKLATIIKFNINNSVNILEAPTKFFNPKEGSDILERSSINYDKYLNEKAELLEKSYSLSAVSASVKYYNQKILKNGSNNFNNFDKYRVKYETINNTMLIDSKTIVGLELTENKFDKNGLSLFKFLDNTCTKMGQRTLRNNILQPLTDKDNIEMRLKVVQEFEKNTDSLSEIRNSLKKLQDLDKLFSKLLSNQKSSISPEQKINYILSLKESISIILTLRTEIIKLVPKSKILNEIKEILENPLVTELFTLFNSYINEDARWATSPYELQNQRTYAIKSGTNGLLAVSRELYKNTVDEIMSHIDAESEKLELALDYSYDSTRCFFLKIKKDNNIIMENFPPSLINIVNKKKYYECTTVTIMKLNLRLRELQSEITLISENVIDSLLNQMDAYIAILFMVSEAISLLDLLTTFTFNSLGKNYCYPTFSDKLYLVESRHPILENTVKQFIPNDISSTALTSRMQVITGCNKSGKSVYLKQIALLCIMAQMGSPIPADIACLPLYDKLHARVCHDTLEITSSTFTFEMKEMAYFLDNLTQSTLLIVDELGRGSSIGDGFIISLSISEFLLKAKATVFLSTHFHDLAVILQQNMSVSHLSMKTILEENQNLKMLFKVSTEIVDTKNTVFYFIKPYYPKDLLLKVKQIQELLIVEERQKAKNNQKFDNKNNIREK
ncbi:hypothetical protein TPHA_0D00620 [Tetrapisispora phaffii CBS 4417]|uniref:DNA mismatch repair proteins mutS family domain-containing protein n=1 Tax=Tetrapisispora phaffii (strain ATCC 24235 / CBS 4417 / NBRC 1672 / NRRL Y-8282 / UCD 70-5) TaxID=1071381 RepID=G8BS85_TETPH|nr:hypothetical protein TPHA_0D00620 [Tetrapisispora phaffii CBS 4417]CCE62706.1 hypothetical protein TPHA_0D00620 [Tetrapisispora phaffii CBS 4417]